MGVTVAVIDSGSTLCDSCLATKVQKCFMKPAKLHAATLAEPCHQNKPKDPVQTVKKKEVLIVLPFLGYHSKHLKKQLRSCINRFYMVKIVFQNTRRMQVFFPLQR